MLLVKEELPTLPGAPTFPTCFSVWRYQREIIRSHKSQDRQYGKKDKHWSTKHYTENWRLSNMNHTKTGENHQPTACITMLYRLHLTIDENRIHKLQWWYAFVAYLYVYQFNVWSQSRWLLMTSLICHNHMMKRSDKIYRTVYNIRSYR
jgi:hypothetical protein